MSAIQKTTASVVMIEDNFLIAQEVLELLTPAGFQPVGHFSSYIAGLEGIDRLSVDYCILDLDLRGQNSSAFGPGEEGRRLLSVLSAKNIPTVIYSAYTRLQHQLDAIHNQIVIVDKLDPAEHVVTALKRLRDPADCSSRRNKNTCLH